VKTLLAGPYVGEIGWELMSWQAHVRRIFRDGGFDRLVVLGAAGRQAFYEDMAADYRVVDLSGLPGEPCEDRRVDACRRPLPVRQIQACIEPMVQAAIETLRSEGQAVTTLLPPMDGRLLPCDPAHQRFIEFRRVPRDPMEAPWVVLVMRQRAFNADQNWPAACWEELYDLLTDRGVNVSSYPNEAAAAIEMLSGCDLAVGHSTGGLHLAALCGCPRLVWSWDDSVRGFPWGMTQRQRYQTLWNPLGSPVIFQGLREPPAPAVVAAWIEQALERIGRRTGRAWHRRAFRAVWRTRNCLYEHVVRRPSFRRWPWRLQEFVRYGLI